MIVHYVSCVERASVDVSIHWVVNEAFSLIVLRRAMMQRRASRGSAGQALLFLLEVALRRSL